MKCQWHLGDWEGGGGFEYRYWDSVGDFFHKGGRIPHTTLRLRPGNEATRTSPLSGLRAWE